MVQLTAIVGMLRVNLCDPAVVVPVAAPMMTVVAAAAPVAAEAEAEAEAEAGASTHAGADNVAAVAAAGGPPACGVDVLYFRVPGCVGVSARGDAAPAPA